MLGKKNFLSAEFLYALFVGVCRCSAVGGGGMQDLEKKLYQDLLCLMFLVSSIRLV